MRQGQQNRRGRGRNRKGGGHHNPLTRSYESNGPDVKIRGTPAHIAEKYISLARDALSSGDPVLAENYLQHAEHYNRIIMSFREQQMQQGGDMNGGMRRPYAPGAEPFEGQDDFDEDGEEDETQPAMARGPDFQGQQQQPRSFDHQPRHDDRPQRHERHERHDRNDRHDRNRQHGEGHRQHRDQFGQQRQFDRQDRQDRQDRHERHDRGDRFDRGERQERLERHERPERDRPERIERPERTERADHQDRFERAERPERAEQTERVERAERPERVERERPQRVAADPAAAEQPPVVRSEAGGRRAPRERFADQSDQPEFLRRPVRRRRESTENGNGEAPPPDANPVDKTTA